MSQMTNNNIQVENLPSSSSTVIEELSPTSTQTIQISLQKRKNSKKVVFTEDTVDNENLNRKKSKCCCIYEKPRTFDESESESEEDCENCYGHKNKKKPDNETNE